MATGLPTIVPGAWAPYERFILPELRMDSSLVDSPFGQEHPGQMFKPDYDSLVESYKRLDEDYHRLAGVAYRNSFSIHEEYDWDKLTADAFAHIVAKFS
jgi:hypothetical protein